MADRRTVDELTLEELERLLIVRRRQARLERLRQLEAQGRLADGGLQAADEMPRLPRGMRTAALPVAHLHAVGVQPPAGTPPAGLDGARPVVHRRRLRDRLLLSVEVLALAGLLYVVVSTYETLRTLNQEVAMVRAAPQELIAPTPTPLVHFDRLPGGHTPPDSPGGTAPDVPLHLQQWVQPAPAQPVPVPAVGGPTRIVIPRIELDAPIVEGVTWEDLKKGVGHLPGSAHPGQRGNLYLAAHNDVFGEIFRYLDKMELGDEFFVYSGSQAFRYVVASKRIIEPTEVGVMYPTTEPIATLQTCYPYLVDTQRLVVIGELAE
jgi:sortase A